MAAWDELNWKQLKQIWTLYQRYADTDGARLRAEVWCLLHNLRPTGNIRWDTDLGIREVEFRPTKPERHRSFRSLVWAAGSSLHTKWTPLPEWSEDVLHTTKFLDTPFGTEDNPACGLLKLPIEEIKIGHHKYRLPGELLTDITYEQYTNMQANTEDPIAFLSHAIIPSRWAWTERVGENYRFHLHRTYEYSAAAADTTYRRLSKLTKGLSGEILKSSNREISQSSNREIVKLSNREIIQSLYFACLQHLQSCMQYYAIQFPDLFRGSGKQDKRSPLIATVSTMNAVMKYNGYTRQQEVFDSNAIFILEILNTMAKESHEIEKMNAKIKHK